MVATKNYRTRDLALANGLVESQSNLGAAFCVGVKDASLRTNHELVAACLTNPMDVVCHLTLYLIGSVLHDFLHHASCNFVCLGEVGRIA